MSKRISVRSPLQRITQLKDQLVLARQECSFCREPPVSRTQSRTRKESRLKSDNESIRENSKRMGAGGGGIRGGAPSGISSLHYPLPLAAAPAPAYLAFSGYLMYLHTNKWLRVGVGAVVLTGKLLLNKRYREPATDPKPCDQRNS